MVPQPPTGLVMPHTAELVFTILGAVPLVVVVFIALRQLRRGQGPLLLFCLIGGGLSALYEPFVDVLGLVYLTEHGAIGTFTFLGRTMPLFVPLIYPWYVGGLAYLTCRALVRGIDRRRYFGLWGLFALANYALEAPGLLTGVYTYYGNQPWNLWGHPLWWGGVNALTAMLAGTLVYALRCKLAEGWRLAAVIPLIYMADGLANAGTGWPMYIVLHDGRLPMIYDYGASIITLALIVFLLWAMSLFVTRSVGDRDRVETRPSSNGAGVPVVTASTSDY